MPQPNLFLGPLYRAELEIAQYGREFLVETLMILVAFPHTKSSLVVFTAQCTEEPWEYIQFPRVSLHLNCVRELIAYAPDDQIPVLHVISESRLSSDIHIQNRNTTANMFHLLRGIAHPRLLSQARDGSTRDSRWRPILVVVPPPLSLIFAE